MDMYISNHTNLYRPNMDFNFDHLFTTDPDIIQNQIMASKYKTEIDSKVITKINQHVDDETFRSYVGGLEDEEYNMYIKYLNSFYKNQKIEKLVYKENISADDFKTLHFWFIQFHDAYQYDKSHNLSSSS
jgi:hypothetical protein